MTIDEAIKTIEKEVRYTYRRADQNIPNAFRLGIEALKRIKECCVWDEEAPRELLPGETEE